jgi:PhnB protein
MAITGINPYFMFDGDAEKAIKLYEEVLGAKTEGLSRWGDVQGMPMPEEAKNRIMHARLTVGSSVFMISDGQPGDAAPKDSMVQVALDFDDVADMKARFAALAKGGKVRMEPQEMFWGATFGQLTDAFGIKWMFNCDKKKA